MLETLRAVQDEEVGLALPRVDEALLAVDVEPIVQAALERVPDQRLRGVPVARRRGAVWDHACDGAAPSWAGS